MPDEIDLTPEQEEALERAERARDERRRAEGEGEAPAPPADALPPGD